MLVLGLDLSLGATGVALLDTGPGVIATATIKSKPCTGVANTVERLNKISDRIMAWVAQGLGDQWYVHLAVIEAPAFSQGNGMAHERGGLWWMVADKLAERRIPTMAVEPNVRAKYATGNGRSGKDEVMLATAKRYPYAPIADNNMADAVLLAAMGARLLGHPVESTLPVANLAAMKTLLLP